jgi:hypothetical protein
MKEKLMFAAVLAVVLVSISTNAAVIYTEDFDGDGTGSINGKVTTSGGGTWIANTIVTDDGVNDGTNEGSAVLPFAPEINRIYTLSMDVDQTGIANVGLGFTTGAPANPGVSDSLDRFLGNFSPGVAWGQLNSTWFRAWEGLKAVNRLAAVDYTTVWASPYTLSIVIDTTGDGSSFTAEFFVNGVSQNTSGGPDTIDVVSVAAITHVGFCRIDGDPLTVDNFLLTVTNSPYADIPDPFSGEVLVEADLSARTVPGKLSWVAPEAYTGATYDVYFGTTEPNLANPAPYGLTKLTSTPQSATSIAPTAFLPLDNEADYYWVVDAYEPNTVPVLHQGAVWNFTTIPSDFELNVIAGSSYITWISEIQATPQVLTGTVDDKGDGDVDLAGIDWTITGYPGDPVDAVAQMIRRQSGINYTTAEMAELVALGNDPNFLTDWIGTDNRDIPGDPLVIRLSGLSAGTYTWTSTHHDMTNQTGTFDVAIDGISKGTGIDISDSNQVPTVFTATFTADGVNPVKVVFDHQDTASLTGLFAMNGFELTDGVDTLKVDFGSDPNYTGTGYQHYGATHEILTTFTAQQFTAGAMNVTVEPLWGPRAAGWINPANVILTDTSSDPLSPTATFTTDYAGDYEIMLTATETLGELPDYSDFDTLTVRVAADACAAAKLSGVALNDYDVDGNCVVGLSDLAVFAVEWLKDVSLTGSVPY